MSNESPNGIAMHRFGPVGTLVGILGLGAWGAMFMMGDEHSKQMLLGSYLYAFIAMICLTLGCFGLTLLHHTVRGVWGLPLLRFFEAGGGPVTLGFMAVAFVPVAIGLHSYHLFPWADPSHVDEIIRAKQWWLNEPRFLAFAALYFAIWIGFAAYLRRSSVLQDTNRDPNEAIKRTNVSAPGILIFFFTVTAAMTDWAMSLQPHWYSTVWGAWFAVGAALMAMSFASMLLMMHRKQQPFTDIVVPGLTKDLGNLMFTMTMLWCYLMLSQFLIIWSANLKEEITYFIARSELGWFALGWVVIIGQFFLPFLVLLAPRTKAMASLLVKVAAWIFVLRFLDLYWVIIPALRKDGPVPQISDAFALLGLGGLWFSVFVAQHKKANAFPLHDPRIRQVVEHAS